MAKAGTSTDGSEILTVMGQPGDTKLVKATVANL